MCKSEELSLEDLLAHKPPMILLSGYEAASFTEEGVRAWVDISEDSLFYEEATGGVPSSVGLEYMAQTIACYVGLATRSRGESPKVGFVLGTRNLSLGIPFFRRGVRYRIETRLLFEDAGFASFSARILDPAGECVSDGVINAFQPEDPDKLLKERGEK